MTKKYTIFLVVTFVVISFLFVSSSYLNTSDNIHQQGFNNKYNVYSVLKPNNLTFAKVLKLTHF